MSAVEEWSEDKDSKIAALAVLVANSAPSVSEALVEMKSQVDLEIKPPSIHEWLNYYRDHRSILAILQALFFHDVSKKFIKASVKRSYADLSHQDLTHFQNLYDQPATLFFFKVWAPCSIYYQTTSTMLFREARLGNINAFEKLLRLDNSVVFDRKLSEIFHQVKSKPNKKDYRKLLLAFHKPVTGRNDTKHIKAVAAAAISIVSEENGKRLSEPEIRKLFDAIAIDKGQGLQDEEIPATPDTFAQSIRRESKKMKGKTKT